MIQVPILTYHANNINGMDYHNNDHVALAADLQLIHQLGLNIVSLDQLMHWRLGHAADSTVENSVVLTCDDGTDFDYLDLDHPDFGVQLSFFNILKQHQDETGQSVHMTNFVIASPEARVILDQCCMVGKGWWSDDWWLTAQQSGIMAIANHSWDHNHGALKNLNINDDSFRHIDTLQQCEQQINQAQNYIQKILGQEHAVKHFAYPYGNHSDYLRFEYLPQNGEELGLMAAFTTEPHHVTPFSDIWAMPRYVCNNDWKDCIELKKILIPQKITCN